MSTPLETLDGPLAFRVASTASLGLDAPASGHDHAYRTRLRSLEWMQKEALVTAADGPTWRLPTDEGAYLDAADVAPPPLGNATAGLLGCYAAAIRAAAESRGIDPDTLAVALECLFTAEGSALRGDRRARALAPELEVRIEEDASVAVASVEDLVERAVAATPVTGALGGEHENRFAVTVNGEAVDPGGLPALSEPATTDPASAFDALPRDVESTEPPVVRHTGRRTAALENADARYAAKLGLDPGEDPGHVIHLRGTATPREDGTFLVEQRTYRPRASVFEFLVEGPGGPGRAPDGLAYLSAAASFCLTTHLTHYADMRDVELDYRIVQDTAFSGGTGPGDPATAAPVETHLFLETPAGETFAREAVQLAVASCYVHDCWQRAVEPVIRIVDEAA